MNYPQKNVITILVSALLLVIGLHLTPEGYDLWQRTFVHLSYLLVIYAAFVLDLRIATLITLLIGVLFWTHGVKPLVWSSEVLTDLVFQLGLYLTLVLVPGLLVARSQQRHRDLAKVANKLSLMVSKSLIDKNDPSLPISQKLTYKFDNMIGENKEMQKVYELIGKASASTANVLITGESGTGKELVARSLHYSSKRKDKPFVAINCSAIPDTLLESELFGYKKGAFTGANDDKLGKFEIANGGTVFLDEICEMKKDLQAKLLRVIQEREFQSLGSNETKKIDIWLLSASSRDLEKEIRDRAFLEALFYRLNVIPVHIPPLRSRLDDIPLLVDHFIQKYSTEDFRMSEKTLEYLQSYDWPGNVRELENVVQRAVALHQGGSFLPEDLPENIKKKELKIGEHTISLPEEGINLEELEKSLIVKALSTAQGNQTKAAKLLGLSRATLIYRLEKHHLR